jgi:inner membrane protein
MPTPVAHSLAGSTIALLSTGRRPLDRKLLAASLIAASFADIDFGISFLIGRNVHHYFTHSLGFALLFTGTAFLLSRAFARERPAFDALVLVVSYLSHLLLDMLSKDTAPPYGLQLFWPLSGEFYISPVLVFDDIWRGTIAKLFGRHNWLAVVREILIVGPPTALALWLWKRRQEYS